MAIIIFSFIPLLLIGLLFFIFWIIMLVDAATRKFKESNDKIVWVLVVILASGLGALIYYFAVYMKHKGKSLGWFWILLLIMVVLFVLLNLII